MQEIMFFITSLHGRLWSFSAVCSETGGRVLFIPLGVTDALFFFLRWIVGAASHKMHHLRATQGACHDVTNQHQPVRRSPFTPQSAKNWPRIRVDHFQSSIRDAFGSARAESPSPSSPCRFPCRPHKDSRRSWQRLPVWRCRSAGAQLRR